MKIFLLLVVSLMTGGAKGCREGWVEFTCRYPDQNKIYEKVGVEIDEQEISIINKNEWENKHGVSLYHDTNNKNLKVFITQLPSQERKYECAFYHYAQSSEEDGEVEVKFEKYDCQNPFVQTAYSKAETTITCDFPGHKYNNKFLCKENEFTCEDISSNKPPNGITTQTESNRVFSESISNVSSQHAGVYWCGVEPKGQMYRAGLKKIQLKVEKITTLSRSPTVGQDFTYWCVYPVDAPIKKFICKGEDPSICEPLASTQSNRNPRFSMTDRKKGNITITVRKITANDTGTYWCGANRTDKTQSNPFFNRLLMTVVPPTTSTPFTISSTSSFSSTQSTTSTADGDGLSPADDPWLTVITAAAVCVALLVLVIILVLVHKRLQRSKHTNKEDHPYDEIQERPQRPDSGTALKTIYATANLPSKPSSASDQDSSHDEVSHTYSTVKDNNPHPTYSTVNHPSRLPEDPFYSTVNNPQQH